MFTACFFSLGFCWLSEIRVEARVSLALVEPRLPVTSLLLIHVFLRDVCTAMEICYNWYHRNMVGRLLWLECWNGSLQAL